MWSYTYTKSSYSKTCVHYLEVYNTPYSQVYNLSNSIEIVWLCSHEVYSITLIQMCLTYSNE